MAKCPKCKTELPDKFIVSEAGRINGRKSILTSAQAKKNAQKRWKNKGTKNK